MGPKDCLALTPKSQSGFERGPPSVLSPRISPFFPTRCCLRLHWLPPVGPQSHRPQPLPSPPSSLSFSPSPPHPPPLSLPFLLGAAPSSSLSSRPKYATPGAIAAAPAAWASLQGRPLSRRASHYFISRIRRETRPPGRQQKVKTQLTPIGGPLTGSA